MKPGRPKGYPRFGGRQKGTPNKIGADIRSMVLEALESVGGADYLKRQAKADPVAFMALLGKPLPTKLQAEDGQQVSLAILIKQARVRREKLRADPSSIVRVLP